MKALLAPLLIFAAPAVAQQTPPPGIWTNVEDAYFAEEEGRNKPQEFAIEIGEEGQVREIDAFGRPESDWEAAQGRFAIRDGRWFVGSSEIRRARPFECWVSVRKFAGKPDGSEDWTFQRGLPVFDQGGRIFVPGEGEAPDVMLRMRNVTWAAGSRNKPSLVIYLHRDDPVRAESYSWASPDATLIGINLRWVQASCSPASKDET